MVAQQLLTIRGVRKRVTACGLLHVVQVSLSHMAPQQRDSNSRLLYLPSLPSNQKTKGMVPFLAGSLTVTGAGKLVGNVASAVRTGESCQQPKIHSFSAQTDSRSWRVVSQCREMTEHGGGPGQRGLLT